MAQINSIVYSNVGIAQTTGTVRASKKETQNPSEGNITRMLFNSIESFSIDIENAVNKNIISEVDYLMENTFKNIPFGTYENAAYQGKNENSMVDVRRILPITKEPVAALNMVQQERPNFDNKTFELNFVTQ